MDLLEKIMSCSNEEEVDEIITEAIKKADENSTKVEQLGFLDCGESNCLFKGFIPFSTRIKYENLVPETYGMETTDFFYDFAHFVRKYNINDKRSLIYGLEYFINSYFGYPGKSDRKTIFNDIAWQTTTTDEEYFTALENNKLGDLRGKGAAECTERGAVAQQILSLFGSESYYCMGCVDLGDRQEGHCFNIVKRNNDYVLLDYSIPVISYKQDGKVNAYYPFIGELSNEEFVEFASLGSLKAFDNYEYTNDYQKKSVDPQRLYIIGSFEIKKGNTSGTKK